MGHWTARAASSCVSPGYSSRSDDDRDHAAENLGAELKDGTDEGAMPAKVSENIHPDRDGRVGEARRAREEVRRTDVGTHRRGCQQIRGGRAHACAKITRTRPRGGDDLREKVGWGRSGRGWRS